MTPDHPTDDTWEQLATGELARDERARVMAHVVGCATCARTWRVLRKIARDARAFDPGVPAAAPDEASGQHAVPFRRTRRALFVGGGAAIAVAAVLLLWLRTGDRGEDVEPAGSGLRGSEHLSIALGSASASRLAWQPVDGAQHYRVEVFSRDGVLVWHRDDVTGATVDIAPPLAAAEYRWQVEAWAGGRRIAASSPARLTVAP